MLYYTEKGQALTSSLSGSLVQGELLIRIHGGYGGGRVTLR